MEKGRWWKINSSVEILPRDFVGLLNKKSQEEYEKRKLSEANYTDDIDNEILKYEPKIEKFIKSKLTGTNIPINKFTNPLKLLLQKVEIRKMIQWIIGALPHFLGREGATQSMKVEAFQNKLQKRLRASKFNYHKKK